MLLIISLACTFLIFLDYHKSRNIHKSIIYVVVFIAILYAFSLALDFLKFKLLYLVILIPSTLFGLLYFKNRSNQSNQTSENDELDSF
ncbi:MAG: hypothetical protein COA38_08050 [Fluviicola sp.]|nr:MAG: hypothetical protein COA38_08050 [Fluviicola sp.]